MTGQEIQASLECQGKGAGQHLWTCRTTSAPQGQPAACSEAGRDPQTGQADLTCSGTPQCELHPVAAAYGSGPGPKLITSCVRFQVGAIRELLSRALPVQTASEVKPATG